MLDKFGKNVITEDVLFEIARGEVPGFTPFLKTGENDNIQNNIQTLWPESGNYVYPTEETIMTVSSDETTDTADGTGARTFFISGLDENLKHIYETVTLNGTTAVNTVNKYYRINCCRIITAGSSESNDGNIYIDYHYQVDSDGSRQEFSK